MVEAAQAAAFKNVGALKGRPPASPALLLEALFYRLRNSGPWRDLPSGFGPWRTVYGWFRLWADNGLWGRLLKTVAKAGGTVCLVDGTHIPVHQCGCNPRGGAEHQAMGRTRGGRNTKLMALTDPRGRLLAAALVPGQAYEPKHVMELLPTDRLVLVVGDKAYDDDKLRAALEERGHRHCFPAKSSRREKRPFHRRYYRMRYAVEDFFRRIKRWGGAAVRRDKLASNFMAWLQMAAVFDWLI